jgi:glycosyltransferase involved in cell wall biosynthesis
MTGQSGILRMLVVASDTFPPTRVDVAVLFGEELASRGHRIDWILQSDAACDKSYVTDWGGGRAWVGATDTGASLFARLRKHALGIRNDLRVFARLRSGAYDLVEVKDKFISGVLAVIAARLARRRFVYWLSYPFPEEYLLRARDGTGRYPLLYLIRGTVFRWLLYGVLLRAADHVFVQSEQMRRDIAATGLPLAKMTAVPMGIKLDPDLVAAHSPRALIGAQEKCFLYLGTLAKVRQLDFLIRVLALVRRTVPGAMLYVVGRGDDPTDEQLLLDEARRLDVAKGLVLIGQLPRAQALRYVQEADVCVSPFYPTPVLNSTSPTKLVEYMAMGKAVVANDHPEQRLVIERSGAGLCVGWQEDEFAAAVVRLLEDPALAQQMGARGRRYVLEHRTYRSIADCVERELLRIANA